MIDKRSDPRSAVPTDHTVVMATFPQKQVLMPGKCAPRFIEDLIQYDSVKAVGSDGNILADCPEKREDGSIVPIAIAHDSCRHKYMFKPKQSILPEALSDASSYYKIASYCQDCRHHLDLVVDFRDPQCKRPCPNQSFPLHHFRRLLVPPKSRIAADGQDDHEEHTFVCSSPRCAVSVTVSIRPPRLRSQHLGLLLDPEKINERVQSEIDAAPDRFKEATIPSPANVIHTLKRYIDDVLARRENRRVSATNKAFLMSLGEPCRDLLQYLGFRYEEVDEEAFWFPPSLPEPDQTPPYQDDLSILIDDVEKELAVLWDQRPWAERTKARSSPSHQPTASINEFKRALGCLTYDTIKTSRRGGVSIDLTANPSPSYAGLGALSDFSDDLLIFAYERQKDCDRDGGPFYLSCLQEIGQTRESEALQTKAALVESSGEVSHRDVQRAYQYFGTSPAWDDSSIIGAFRARVSDAPRHDHEARQHLKVIGVARQSQAIQVASADSVTNYQEALAWLGAEESASDDFIITYFTVKVTDNHADEALGRRAVSLVAEERKSAALRSWLETGHLGPVEISIDHAYARLGIEDRTIDDVTILTTCQIRFAEMPDAEAEDMRAALRAIGKARQSRMIEEFLQGPRSQDAAMADWPVGLENIGNTCYLNSLLQFYFTVKPLRELVLDFGRFEMQVTPETVSRKRVGSRKVSTREVERAKKFVFELQKLFVTLIKAPSSSITPEREMARLTLIKSSDEEVYRRRSTVGSRGRPALGEIDGVAVQGPMPPALQFGNADAEPSAPPSTQERQGSSDDASDVTLVDVPIVLDDGADSTMANAEPGDPEVGASASAPNRVSNRENAPPPGQDPEEEVAPPAGSSTNEVAPPASKQDAEESSIPGQGADGDTVMTDGPVAGPTEDGDPPERPPPVPPRPEASEMSQRPIDELELGAQQDVTEVIGNVLFQLECALRPTGIDSNGEQLDEIKDLFYGTLRAYINANGSLRAKEEYFSDIKVNVATGPRDIYAALDGAFDVQEVTIEEGNFPQYTSIARLPPVLQIQVQRVQYDVKNKKTYKSDAHLRLRETIYLDRYMDVEDEVLLQRRQETWQWKEELDRLEARRRELLQTEADMNVPALLHVTRGWISEMQGLLADEKNLSQNDGVLDGIVAGDESVLEELERYADQVTREIQSIEGAMGGILQRIERHFDDFRSLPYRLAAVFIHRGTATFGHYWIYIFDFHRQIWRKYNDGYVTEVQDLSEVFGPQGASGYGDAQSSYYHHDQQQPQQGYSYHHSYPPTPYYLVYVKDEIKHSLIDPVCRDVEVEIELDEMQARRTDVAADPLQIDGVQSHAFSSNSNGTSNGISNVNINGVDGANDAQVIEMQERADGGIKQARDTMYWSATNRGDGGFGGSGHSNNLNDHHSTTGGFNADGW